MNRPVRKGKGETEGSSVDKKEKKDWRFFHGQKRLKKEGFDLGCHHRWEFWVTSIPSFSPLWFLLFSFLDAPSHLYKRLCPSVRRSVRPSVRMSRVFSKVKRTHSRRILCRVSGLVRCSFGCPRVTNQFMIWNSKLTDSKYGLYVRLHDELKDIIWSPSYEKRTNARLDEQALCTCLRTLARKKGRERKLLLRARAFFNFPSVFPPWEWKVINFTPSPSFA